MCYWYKKVKIPKIIYYLQMKVYFRVSIVSGKSNGGDKQLILMATSMSSRGTILIKHLINSLILLPALRLSKIFGGIKIQAFLKSAVQAAIFSDEVYLKYNMGKSKLDCKRHAINIFTCSIFISTICKFITIYQNACMMI